MTETSNLAALEAAHFGRFTFRHGGTVYTMMGPEDLGLHQILAVLDAEHLPGTPPMPRWKRDRLFRAWVAYYDLPSLDQLRRLLFLVDRYRDAIEFDLRYHLNGLDLTTLWKQRRFRFLLNMIDHLPRHSWYTEAVSNDEEHAEMLAKADAARTEGNDEPYHPPLHTWSDEVAVLTDILDATRRVGYAIIASNAEKGKAGKPPEPAPRPQTALERLKKRAKYDVRKERHDALAKRLLPHKR